MNKPVILRLLTYHFTLILSVTSCNPPDSSYLKQAIEVANWLKEQKSGNEIWVDEIGEDKTSLSLSSGVAGKVIFYLELYQATANESHLEEALYGANYLIQEIPQDTSEAKSIRNVTSLYGDVVGSAISFVEMYRVTEDTKWKEAATACLNILNQLSRGSTQRNWSDFNDVLVGNTGTALFYLYIYQQLKDTVALSLALDIAETLKLRAKRNADSIYWHLSEQNNFNLPNFSHGASGIGYFFASLYETTGDVDYLETALSISDYLDLIAWQSDSIYLLPYGFPDIGWERGYDIGWAHGPAGTGRFFVKLWQIMGESKWKQLAIKCANGIEFSGLPRSPNDRFGSDPFPVDMRFGMGGVIDYLLGLKALGIADRTTYLNTLFMALDSLSTRDKNKRYWEIEKYGFMRGEDGDSTIFTGYFYGAAGLGLQYVKMHNSAQGNKNLVRLPDSPY